MIVVENRGEISSLLEKLKLPFGAVRLNGTTLELTKIYANEFYFLSTGVLDGLNEETCAQLCESIALISYGEKVPDNLWRKFPNLIYHHSDGDSIGLLRNQLMKLNQLVSTAEVMRSQMISLNTELSEVMGSLETELLRLKRAHRKKTPRRLEEVKGINFFSKYAAGESMGGEFFDMFKTGHKVFILMSSTSSYLASSSILTFFSALKTKEKITDEMETEFLGELKLEIDKINSSRQKKVEAHIFTAILDLNAYSITGHKLGDFAFRTSRGQDVEINSRELNFDSKIENGSFSYQLSRGEKLMFTSPGFGHNWSSMSADFMPEEVLTKASINSIDILDELFFQMKKDSETGFLNRDASVILLEVDKNVIIKI